MKEKIETFLELDSVVDAKSVDLDKYTFLERLSAVRNKYCFKVRQR